MKPLLFLDVDGVLNPDARSSGRRPDGYTTHRMNPSAEGGLDWVTANRKPLRVWLNHDHGALLLGLPFELVWATTWEHEANEWIGPHLGLPELPVVEFTKPIRRRPDHVHWKLPDLIAYAGDRPFAWLDDEITARDGEHAKTRHPAPTALIQVAPFVGLTEEHLHHLHVWASKLR